MIINYDYYYLLAVLTIVGIVNDVKGDKDENLIKYFIISFLVFYHLYYSFLN